VYHSTQEEEGPDDAPIEQEIEQKLVVSKANLEAGLVYQHYLEKVALNPSRALNH